MMMTMWAALATNAAEIEAAGTLGISVLGPHAGLDLGVRGRFSTPVGARLRGFVFAGPLVSGGAAGVSGEVVLAAPLADGAELDFAIGPGILRRGSEFLDPAWVPILDVEASLGTRTATPLRLYFGLRGSFALPGALTERSWRSVGLMLRVGLPTGSRSTPR